MAKFRSIKEIGAVHELRKAARSLEKMELQAALMCERIIGPESFDGVCRFSFLTTDLIWNSSEKYARVETVFSLRFYPLWLYSLSLNCKHLGPLQGPINKQLRAFRSALGQVLYTDNLKDKLEFKHLLAVFDLAVHQTIKIRRKIESIPVPVLTPADARERFFRSVLYSTIELMCLTCRLVKKAKKPDEERFKSLVEQLIDLDPRGNCNQTLLQLVSSDRSIQLVTSSMFMFPCKKCIKFLKELGAKE